MRSSERRYMQEEQSQGRRQWQPPEEREEHERGLIERVSDEIRSWFGQDEPGRRRYDFDRPEYDEPRRGEYMSQGEEFMGPGLRSRSAGYQGYPGQQGFGYQPYQEYGAPSGMGQYGSQGPRYGMMGERMGERTGQRGQFGPYGGGGQGRYYQQHHETYPQGMHPGQGFGGQGFGGQSFGGQGLGGQGFGSQSYGMQGHGWQGVGGQGVGGRGYVGQGFGGQTEERGRFAGRGPKGYRRSDERVMEEACEVLSRNPFVDASNIEVKVQQGKVSLTGTVDDRETKRLAEDLCEDIPGVREVQNQLRISRSASGMGLEEQGRTSAEQQAQAQSQSPTSGRGREA